MAGKSQADLAFMTTKGTLLFVQTECETERTFCHERGEGMARGEIQDRKKRTTSQRDRVVLHSDVDEGQRAMAAWGRSVQIYEELRTFVRVEL